MSPLPEKVLATFSCSTPALWVTKYLRLLSSEAHTDFFHCNSHENQNKRAGKKKWRKESASHNFPHVSLLLATQTQTQMIPIISTSMSSNPCGTWPKVSQL